MLKGIPSIIQPSLLKILSEMGHGDTIVIADAHFPAESVGRNSHVIRYDGQFIEPLMDAILQLIPLDQYVEKPVTVMDKVQGDAVETPIWEKYEQMVESHDKRGSSAVERLDRFAFYKAASNAYCIVATGEQSQYANVIVKKGVIH